MMRSIFLFSLALMATTLSIAQEHAKHADQSPNASHWQYVDPRIGSVGVGRTFPGPSMPYGLVKPGPDCGVTPNAGWAPMPEPVLGFSQTHVSGTGGGQKYGNILIQPFIATEETTVTPLGLPQRRISEEIALGYYTTTYENGIRTEITTGERCAYYRLHYPTARGASLLIDATHFLGKDSVPDLRERQQFVGGEVEMVNDHEVRGYSRIRGGWNNGEAYTVYFAIEVGMGLPTTPPREGVGGVLILSLPDTLVDIKIGISYVSSLQAAKNIGSIGFDEQLSTLRQAWEQQLCKVEIEGTETQRRMFYTALYHTMLMPVDKTGENPKWTDTPYYDDYYAIWDTYRTSSPLITLLDPQRETAIVNSLLNIYRREGYLPDARSGDFNGRTQGGSNADVVIADAYAKGLSDIDYELALAAMLKDGDVDPGADHEKHGRGGLNEYKRLGYIPYGIDRAGTRTVEYAFCDYCIAQVARGLGYDEIAENYTNRSQNWRNLWRADYEFDGMRGFIMPRDEQGHWLDSVNWGNRSHLSSHDSTLTSHKIPYTPTTKVAPWYIPWWSTFFYEATSEEYSLSIPHDVKGLIDACGGTDSFRRRLDLFFEKGYYNVQNEPSFLSPCLYHWIGRPDLSTQRIHQIVRDHYTDRPDGLPGNDDSGAMSSWLAFHMMGLYPLAGTDTYLLNIPLIRAYTIKLPNGRHLHVVTEGQGEIYKTAHFNGKKIKDARITHGELMEGGELRMKSLTPNPSPKSLTPNLSPKERGVDRPAGRNKVKEKQNKTIRGRKTKAIKGRNGQEIKGSIAFTLNRQFRTWPISYVWQDDTLMVQCKETTYFIPLSEVDETDAFCWLNPQKDGTVYHDVRGTFCMLSRRAFKELREQGITNFDGTTWRRIDETDELLHASAVGERTEMWVSKTAKLPLIKRMTDNFLGIDWEMKFD